MGRMSDWMIDMEEQMGIAIDMGASSSSEVITSCREGLGLVDEKFIKSRLQELFGPGDNFTVDQEPEL